MIGLRRRDRSAAADSSDVDPEAAGDENAVVAGVARGVDDLSPGDPVPGVPELCRPELGDPEPGDAPGQAGGHRWWRGWRRVLLLAGGALALAALAVGAWWLLFTSTVLDVRSVQVEGTRALTPDRVRQAAAVPTGGPLARADTRAAAGRVLALPGVADVEVSRGFPHTVTVRVTERVPIAVLAATGGQRRLLDAQATVWLPPGPVPAGLPVLVDRDGTLDAGAVDTAVRVSTSLPAALHDRVRALVPVSPGSVVLVLRDDRVVVWGSPDQPAAKVRVATALLGATKARYVDVSAPTAPVTRARAPEGLVPS